jgi:hypothetical protein
MRVQVSLIKSDRNFISCDKIDMYLSWVDNAEAYGPIFLVSL